MLMHFAFLTVNGPWAWSTCAGVFSFCDLSAGQCLDDHERGLQCGVVPGPMETVLAAGRARLPDDDKSRARRHL